MSEKTARNREYDLNLELDLSCLITAKEKGEIISKLSELTEEIESILGRKAAYAQVHIYSKERNE